MGRGLPGPSMTLPARTPSPSWAALTAAERATLSGRPYTRAIVRATARTVRFRAEQAPNARASTDWRREFVQRGSGSPKGAIRKLISQRISEITISLSGSKIKILASCYFQTGRSPDIKSGWPLRTSAQCPPTQRGLTFRDLTFEHSPRASPQMCPSSGRKFKGNHTRLCLPAYDARRRAGAG